MRLLPLEAAATGASLMYFFDPAAGRRRRARLQQKSQHAINVTRTLVAAGRRDLANRARGRLHLLRARLDRGPVPDALLEARVRARLGRVCSHPHAVHVAASEGHVVLSGPILASEVEQTLRTIGRVPGVRAVENQLAPHESGAHIPALQGGLPRPGERPEILQRAWSPSVRLLAGALGLVLVLRSLRRRGLGGLLAALAGGGLLLRGITNQDARRIVGAGGHAVEVQKTILVQAPPETVFALWQRLEDFPRIMSHVKEVRRNEDGTYHWTVTGPGAVGFEFDAEITEIEPDHTIAWRSLPGAPIENAGVVRFVPADGGGTQIEVRLSYNPPGGRIGHAFASLLGAGPKKQLDDDLLRFKTLVETGRTRGRNGPVTLEELLPQAPSA